VAADFPKNLGEFRGSTAILVVPLCERMFVETMRVAGPTGALVEAVDRLVGAGAAVCGTDGWGDAALADELVVVRRQIDRLEARFAELAWAAHRRGIGSADGCASTAAWLRWRAGMREGDARGAIEAGEICQLLPDTGAAWVAGEISSGAARTIVGTRVAGHDDQLVACEPVLLDFARTGELRGLRRAAAHFRNLARADGSAPGHHDGVHLSRTFDGRSVLSAELSDLAAETVTTALHASVDAPSDSETRTRAQRYAAALVRICEIAITHARDNTRTAADAGRGSGPGVESKRPRPQVSMVVDWTTLTSSTLGRTDGLFTGPIHPHDVQRALCDSSISRIVTGPGGLPLDVGRTRRTVPPSLRRALAVRDGGCRFPGCDRPPGWCDAHHVIHWLHGGHTALDNLVLCCDHHHNVLHQPGWTTTFDGHELHIDRPDGLRLTE